MKNEIREKLKTYFTDFEGFEDEIVIAEDALVEMKEESLLSDEMFWNHYLSLVIRIRNNEQNQMEIDANDMSDESRELSDQFAESLSCLNLGGITAFERYLLAIYFEKHRKEVGKQ